MASTSARSCPASAGSSPTARPTGTSPGRRPTCRRRPSSSGGSRPPGSPPPPAPPSGRAPPSCWWPPVADVLPRPGALLARTTRLDADVDLLLPGGVLFEGPDLGLAGGADGIRLELPTGPGRVGAAAGVVAEALAAITVED